MEITFRTEIDGEKNFTEITVSKIESGAFISITQTFLGIKEEQGIHFLSKESLSDFIGALLHVQSKLRK